MYVCAQLKDCHKNADLYLCTYVCLMKLVLFRPHKCTDNKTYDTQ